MIAWRLALATLLGRTDRAHAASEAVGTASPERAVESGCGGRRRARNTRPRRLRTSAPPPSRSSAAILRLEVGTAIVRCEACRRGWPPDSAYSSAYSSHNVYTLGEPRMPVTSFRPKTRPHTSKALRTPNIASDAVTTNPPSCR